MYEKSLAVVETPLQLLCAYEALEGNGWVILRLTGVGRNDRQTLSLAEELGMRYKAVNAPPRKPLAMLFAIWAMRRLLFRKYQAVYLGSYFSRFIRSIAVFLRGPVFILDDGVATLLAQTSMQYSSKRSSIFTFLPVRPLSGQTCIKHSFERLRERFQASERKCLGAYFIGQPLVEKGMVDESSYLALLQCCLKEAGGKMEYIAHRAESEVILKKVGTFPGLTVRMIDFPVELYFLTKVPPPELVYSCISTALFSLSMILPNSRIEARPLNSLNGNPKAPHVGDILQAMKESERISVRAA